MRPSGFPNAGLLTQTLKAVPFNPSGLSEEHIVYWLVHINLRDVRASFARTGTRSNDGLVEMVG